MNVPLYGVVAAVLILFVTLFGLGTIFKIVIVLLVLVAGILTSIYGRYATAIEEQCKNRRENLYKKTDKLRQILEDASKRKVKFTSDRRVTGSHVIDESLQEILDFILRDHVEPWYGRLTDDEEFTKSVRDTAQKIAINLANRVKDVDWIPYLTTRLVDDAASHVRLYRQARAKMKSTKSPRIGGSSSTSGSTPKKSATPTHRRNKSETDISWYSQSKFYVPNLGSLTEPGIEASNDDENSLEKIFFDLEVQMENNLISRDLICTNENHEINFLAEISEILLFLLLPKEDFECLTVRIVLRELLVNVVIKPMINLLSDPDYINQACIWLCAKEMNLPSEMFLTVIRITDNLDELTATQVVVTKEIAHLRSKDSGGEDDLTVKQRLNSMLYVKKIIDNRIRRMKEGLENDLTDGMGAVPVYRLLVPGQKLVNLPLDELLKNNIALSYYMDYMMGIGAEAYLYFYLNISGWKVSAEQVLSDIELQRLAGNGTDSQKSRNVDLENLKEAAVKIYQQYLGDKASVRLQLDDVLVKTLASRIKYEYIRETWFDELQICCYDKLQSEDRFLPAFKRSISYVKLLADLDLLKDPISEEDSRSLDSISVSSLSTDLDIQPVELEPRREDETVNRVKSNPNSSTQLASLGMDFAGGVFDEADLEPEGNSDSGASQDGVFSDSKKITRDSDVTFFLEPAESERYLKIEDGGINDQNAIKKLQQGRFEIMAEIIGTGIHCDSGKPYGIYAVAVTKRYDTGYQEKWHVYRRYSDFHDLHQKIKDKYYDLAKVPFPAKKTFHNMDRAVLEKRMTMLNAWLQQLTRPLTVDGHLGLQSLLLVFLEQGEYDKGVTGGHVARTLDTLVNPLKTSMKNMTQAVKTMPDNMLSTVDGVMDNISKFFGNPKKTSVFLESVKVGASLDTETDDNIPLRIILLLMDEVFDLKVKNQWLRRRIVTLLRQIIRMMFGDIVNRRIVEYVSLLTSPKNVATYLKMFKQSFWPNGVKAEAKPPRDDEMKSRTRVAAKIALLSCFSDELKHIIGSETTRRGLLRVFQLFQEPVLNRRLLYVLLEGIIENLFPKNDLVSVIRKLYSSSSRVKVKDKCDNRPPDGEQSLFSITRQPITRWRIVEDCIADILHS